MKKQFPAVTAIALLAALFAQTAGAASDLDKATEVFKKLDVDNNGYINLKEAKASPDVDEEFADGDTNEDGLLSMAEFTSMEIVED